MLHTDKEDVWRTTEKSTFTRTYFTLMCSKKQYVCNLIPWKVRSYVYVHYGGYVIICNKNYEHMSLLCKSLTLQHGVFMHP